MFGEPDQVAHVFLFVEGIEGPPITPYFRDPGAVGRRDSDGDCVLVNVQTDVVLCSWVLYSVFV